MVFLCFSWHPCHWGRSTTSRRRRHPGPFGSVCGARTRVVAKIYMTIGRGGRSPISAAAHKPDTGWKTCAPKICAGSGTEHQNPCSYSHQQRCESRIVQSWLERLRALSSSIKALWWEDGFHRKQYKLCTCTVTRGRFMKLAPLNTFGQADLGKSSASTTTMSAYLERTR